MQLGNACQGKNCARCQPTIESDPAFADDLWYHRTCLDEGTRALHRAEERAARFGFVSADSRTAEAPGDTASTRRMEGARTPRMQGTNSSADALPYRYHS